MKLTDLLYQIGQPGNGSPLQFQGAVLDSRQVQVGDLFIAIPGQKSDGRAFIQEAIQKGAVAVLSEQAVDASSCTVPVVQVPKLSNTLAHIAEVVYPAAKQQPLVAVTGTNGKTSIVQWLASILEQTGGTCGTIGTLGTGFPGRLDAGHLTTPDILALYRTLEEFRRLETPLVAMEASSIALQQQRVAGLSFHTAIFSNFSADHLDYHGDMDAYWAAKEQLFTQYPVGHTIVNLDDAKSQGLLSKIHTRNACYGVTVKPKSCEPHALNIPTIRAVSYELSPQGMRAEIISPWGEGCLKSKLFGLFNLSNLLSVLAGACLQGLSLQEALDAVDKLQAVPGRMQVLRAGPLMPKVIVDYAHTPDALEQLLSALKQHCRGQLICVFGCGGDRDRLKRPVMREVAEAHADKVIVTADNPRFEAMQSIFNDILQGTSSDKVTLIEDRKAAIDAAISSANQDDIVVLAGKGHEQYQIIRDEKIPFCDLTVASSILRTRDPICEL